MKIVTLIITGLLTLLFVDSKSQESKNSSKNTNVEWKDYFEFSYFYFVNQKGNKEYAKYAPEYFYSFFSKEFDEVKKNEFQIDKSIKSKEELLKEKVEHIDLNSDFFLSESEQFEKYNFENEYFPLKLGSIFPYLDNRGMQVKSVKEDDLYGDNWDYRKYLKTRTEIFIKITNKDKYSNKQLKIKIPKDKAEVFVKSRTCSDGVILRDLKIRIYFKFSEKIDIISKGTSKVIAQLNAKITKIEFVDAYEGLLGKGQNTEQKIQYSRQNGWVPANANYLGNNKWGTNEVIYTITDDGTK
jgi:hypothetical protein